MDIQNATLENLLNCIHVDSSGLPISLIDLRKRALTGDSEAAEQVALELIRNNNPEAFSWATKLYKEGFAAGKALVGACYLFGIGVDVDTHMGLEKLDQAADEGYSRAYYFMAINILRADMSIKNTNFKSVVEYLVRGSNAGSVECYIMLAMCFLEGLGVVPSKVMAHYYLSLAAEKNHVKAFGLLGILHLQEDTPFYEPELAVEYFKHGCYLNSPGCFTPLGAILLSGRQGVEKDATQAFQLLQRAVELGDSDALVVLGNYYAKKDSDNFDYDLARKYYQQAIEMGNEDAPLRLKMLEDPEAAAAEIGFDGIPNFNKLLEEDDPDAHYHLGLCLLNGHTFLGEKFEQSYEKGAECMKHAAALGQKNAPLVLAKIYLLGSLTGKPDYDEAEKWARPLADAGDGEAMYIMGGIAERRGDKDEAMLWLEGSVAVGDCAESLMIMARMCLNKEEPDYERALALLVKAAELGDAEAWLQLAIWRDHNMPIDHPNDTIECLVKAVKLGHSDAAVLLGCIYAGFSDERSPIFFDRYGDKILAHDLFNRAIVSGNVDALFFKGRLMYCDAQNPEEYAEAMKTIQEAANKGSEEAAQFIKNVKESGSQQINRNNRAFPSENINIKSYPTNPHPHTVNDHGPQDVKDNYEMTQLELRGIKSFLKLSFHLSLSSLGSFSPPYLICDFSRQDSRL